MIYLSPCLSGHAKPAQHRTRLFSRTNDLGGLGKLLVLIGIVLVVV